MSYPKPGYEQENRDRRREMEARRRIEPRKCGMRMYGEMDGREFEY
jgi:hypothetical protein